jgi:glycosyltransferase involved in cell wall biosynthesis
MASMAHDDAGAKRILQIGNWPPPVCSWTMSLVLLRRELEARGWECQVMNLNENRRLRSPDYIDVQNGWDYFSKVWRCVRHGCAVHTRVNGETRKGYFLSLIALVVARLRRRPALLTYGGGPQQTYFPAPRLSLRHLAFRLIFSLPQRIYCNSEAVKKVLLSTGVSPSRVVPLPHFSPQYVEFKPVPVSPDVAAFFERHEGVFFSYVCFRKEFELDFLAGVIRRFHEAHPRVGFALVGAWDRELAPLNELLAREGLTEHVLVLGSLSHDYFLTLLARSLAYLRTPITDGVCASVLESLTLRVPVIAVDNGTRPPGTLLYRQGDADGMQRLMERVERERASIVAALPHFVPEDNARKLADSVEEVCLRG